MQCASDLVAGGLIAVQIGDHHQAETVVELPGRAGDLLKEDRGSGIYRTLHALCGMQSAALLRFSPTHCRLEQADGAPLVVRQWQQEQAPDARVSFLSVTGRVAQEVKKAWATRKPFSLPTETSSVTPTSFQFRVLS